VRKNGRWGNTQENAAALQALVDYYKKYETETPDFRAVVALGDKTLASGEFRGRSTVAQKADVPMKQLADTAGTARALPLTFRREGTGTLFYMARLRYASSAPRLEAMDQGFAVERSYRASQAEDGAPALTTFAAGDLVRVTLTFRLTKERRFVAVTDPLPAGFEPVETWFATTARDLALSQEREEGESVDWWERGGFDRVERHDDRVLLFATRLSEGVHEFSYVVRATTSGTFNTAPTHVEEMYEPEVFGRTPSAQVTVKP
jgi:alpha-2-macroglobulin